MAAEAEAGREARAKVITAQGEQNAASLLREAALTMSDTPAALQLRYLQTLNTISMEHNSTIIFPFPIDLCNAFMNNIKPTNPQPTVTPYPQTHSQLNSASGPKDVAYM